jgi:peptide/nickel transport system permease protein
MSDTVIEPLQTDPPGDGSAPDREVAIQQIGQWSLIWRRFRRHRLAVIGGYIALFMLALAVIGPFLAPPLANVDVNGETPAAVWVHRNQGPQLWPVSQYVMGADVAGNPVLTYILLGGRPVLAISVLGALLASLIGILIGSLAGYLGRAVDAVLMRLVDAVLAIPFLLLLILLSRYLTDRGVITYILLFGTVGWPGVARLVRGYVLALRRREYAEAARALGVSTPGIILRHILPNALDVIIVSFTLNVGVFLVTEVTLEYLGAGTAEITWGSLLPGAFGSILNAYWWLGVFPGGAILLTVLAVNFLGDGLRDALDATSQTAAFSAYRLPLRERRRGVSRHAGKALAYAMAPPRRLVASARHNLSQQRKRGGALLAAAVPSRVHAWESAGRTRSYAPRPLVLRVGPIVLAFVVAGVAFLYGHSPLRYAPNYAPPTTYGSAYSESEYAALPLPTGGWDLFEVNAQRQVVYERVDAAGGVTARHTVATGDSTSRPAMARVGNRVLGAWVADSGQTIEAAYLNTILPAHPSAAEHPVRLVPPGGIAEHPFVVPVPHGFDVLFDWQRPGRTPFDLELASFRDGSTRPTVSRLLASGDYALYPRGIVDGSAALDVMYLRRTSPGTWHLYFQRFPPAGVPLGSADSLASISYVLAGPNGCNGSDIIPPQWAIDLKRAPDGSVWAAWEDGNDCVSKVGISGTNTLYIGHWSRTGQPILTPTPVDTSFDPGTQAVALALQGRGGQLYYEQQGAVQPYLVGVHFSSSGTVDPPERVSYDGGGNPANPRAGTVGGRPQVVWQKVRGDGTTLQGVSYHPFQSPDLLTRLGLNIGSLTGNLLLVIVGSLGGAILLTVVNIFLLIPLLPVWFVIRRIVSGRVRWPLFLTALALLLTWIFAGHASPPSYVVVISGLTGAARLDAPYRWLVVAGAIFVVAWANRHLYDRQESPLRAAATALTGVYFIATMYLILFIQVEITRI